MKIIFNPMLCWPDTARTPLTLSRQGDKLTISGHEFDFGVVPTGATLADGKVATGCEFIDGPIERDADGVLHLTLRLPVLFSAPEAARFPAPIINPPDGPVTLPQTNWPPVQPQTEQGGDDASN